MVLGIGLGVVFHQGKTVAGVSNGPVAPANTAVPTISGTPRVGQALNSSTGTWSGDTPITYEYQWQVSANGTSGWTNIAGATSAAFTLQGAQQGQFVRSTVRATNAAGQSSWIASDALGPVAAALAAPTMVSAPGITGTYKVGQTLSIGPEAVYDGNPAPSITYRWLMRPNGTGSTTTLATDVSSFALTSAQLGMRIRIQHMATNSQGSTAWSTNAWQGPVT